MELGELETPKESQEPLLLPRRGKRNRKLTVDEVTGISNDAFRKGMMNCIDTMRAKVKSRDVELSVLYHYLTFILAGYGGRYYSGSSLR